MLLIKPLESSDCRPRGRQSGIAFGRRVASQALSAEGLGAGELFAVAVGLSNAELVSAGSVANARRD